MKQLDVYEAKDVIIKSIGYMVYEDRGTLIDLLRKNGVQISDNVSDDDLIKMTYVAIGNSLQFKKDLARYIDAQTKEAYEGYVDEEFFNVDADKKAARTAKKTEKKTAREAAKTARGGSKVGVAVKGIATKENVQAAINTGLGLLADSLSAKADRKTVQEATLLASEKSKQAIAEAQAEDSKKSRIKSWIIPTLIGVVVIGGIVTYFIMKKRKA
tara:strand:- start:701 stop:1342 length:642 start_codon:yes stop_codon:yes gene_type:complete